MMNFNSQVCTTKEQSERLLKLGLKPETADCRICPLITIPNQYLIMDMGIQPLDTDETPAWSLHRLLSIGINGDYMGLWNININIDTVEDLFEQLIKLIEWAIEDGAFNKEYLKQ
jgi:hypothetical protein